MLRKPIKTLFRAVGLDVRHLRDQVGPKDGAIAEMTDFDAETLRRISSCTMTSHERQWAVISAARYISRRKIPGAFVECGVWRGGSSMAAALTFMHEKDTARDLWLFDTYTGLPRPTEHDVDNFSNQNALSEWLERKSGDDSSHWCEAGIEEVRANMSSTGYPQDKIRFIAGKVEETLALPENMPKEIAFLRLDTDFYESTKVELELLFPRLAQGGVMIIDDYGYWRGARQAVDEYFAATSQTYLLNRIDHTGRILIKC
jgi:hypothetical protein